jgi:hypothetical protein
VAWSRAGVLGILAVAGAVQAARDGAVAIAALLAVAGLCWLAATMAFVFADAAETFTGAMLTVCGAATIGLGLTAFASQLFLLGILALPAGATMTAGGLSLLDSQGVLARAGWYFRAPIKTDQNHAAVRSSDAPGRPARPAPVLGSSPAASPAEPPPTPER